MNSNCNLPVLESLLNHDGRIHDNVKFADQKALIFIVLDTTLIGGLWPMIDSKDRMSLHWGLAVCGLLAVAIGFAVAVIVPRRRRHFKRGKGFIDPVRIAMFSTAEEFQKSLSSASELELITQCQIFVYDRSFTDHCKYRMLKFSIWISSIGWAAALVFAAWVKIKA